MRRKYTLTTLVIISLLLIPRYAFADVVTFWPVIPGATHPIINYLYLLFWTIVLEGIIYTSNYGFNRETWKMVAKINFLTFSFLTIAFLVLPSSSKIVSIIVLEIFVIVAEAIMLKEVFTKNRAWIVSIASNLFSVIFGFIFLTFFVYPTILYLYTIINPGYFSPPELNVIPQIHNVDTIN